MMPHFRPFMRVCLAFLLSNITAQQITIVTTLPVFSMIAQEIAQDKAKIVCLSSTQSDTHHFLLTPSQSMALQSADIVISSQELAPQLPVDPEKMISLAMVPEHVSAALIQSRYNVAAWLSIDRHDHDHHDHVEHTTHSAAATDKTTQALQQAQHEWLSPSCMQIIAQYVAQKLIQQDAASADVYQQRLQGFISNLEVIKKQYQHQSLTQQYIIYDEQFVLLEKDLSVSFGPVLYRCCHNRSLSANKVADIQKKGPYRALLVPIYVDDIAQKQLQDTFDVPVIRCDTSGLIAFDNGESYAAFIGNLLQQLYHTD
jgi:ABC-type Zn uptake system ZnuABC Zn-binding protein ZnuA